MLTRHSHEHAFRYFNPLEREGLSLLSRRNLLKAGLAGVAGLTLPTLYRQQAEAGARAEAARTGKSLILLWMTGGPSQIDTWDPKPDRPVQNRGPFGITQSKLPGIIVCEHLPKMAAMMDQFTLIRSVDCAASNHEPNRVLQSGNREGAPRVNPKGHLYPAIGSIVAKHHGANHPSMPGYATFMRAPGHVAFAGYLGKQYDPFIANTAAKLPIYDLVGTDTGAVSSPNLFRLPAELTANRLDDRQGLLHQFDRVKRTLDASGSMEVMDRYQQQAVDMLTGQRMQSALDIAREPEAIQNRYGKHLWCQQVLLARRMVEAGVSFVTLDLSYHTASGTWDTHGDNIPPYGGIKKGLGPLLPLFDHIITTLVGDLYQRGMLEKVLVLAMGEFGRTPQMGTQDSTDGRNHWPAVMSMAVAGGGFKHGQVIGSTEKDGGRIKERAVTPSDLAATIYHHFGVPLDTTYLDPTGRPRNIVEENGKPIAELM